MLCHEPYCLDLHAWLLAQWEDQQSPAILADGLDEENQQLVLRVTMRAPEALARFIAPKGSIALNGTSLTVNEVDGTRFGINFIPHTKEVTTWGRVAVGDRVESGESADIQPGNALPLANIPLGTHIHNIELRIGRRPLVSVGNSNNDASMGRWTLAGERRSLLLWIHHDDAAREYDYDRGTSRIADLCRDLPQAHEVSMAQHWNRVFDHE